MVHDGIKAAEKIFESVERSMFFVSNGVTSDECFLGSYIFRFVVYLYLLVYLVLV